PAGSVSWSGFPPHPSDERGLNAGPLEPRFEEAGLLGRLERTRQQTRPRAPRHGGNAARPQTPGCGRAVAQRKGIWSAQRIALAARGETMLPHPGAGAEGGFARRERAGEYAIPHRAAAAPIVQRDRSHEGSDAVRRQAVRERERLV